MTIFHDFLIFMIFYNGIYLSFTYALYTNNTVIELSIFDLFYTYHDPFSLFLKSVAILK